ncbi:FAD-dependent oxidoreductase [Chelativorans sp. Marseille-P2723]|uniref:dihydrolipoyl dehydrogenase family protein n=1 Tax=Chelativorans sp. Marseille-P2723 TaxID=2709133 RepID=UPI00156E159F|nr:FAD-dependent oxidoreductase [Chelativorans sp. Marseille-P2723]
MITLRPDICVIGGGSGGLTIAAAAAAFGVPVVLIERAKMGGDCLNYGCIPSKSLLASAGTAHRLAQGFQFGIHSPDNARIDFSQAIEHVEGVIAAIAPKDSVGRFSALGVTVLKCEARFKDASTVVAGDHQIRARRYVIATGSSPAIPPIAGLEEVPYLTNKTVFALKERPGHLIVIGAGPVGLELAQAHCRLGARVTVVEAASALGGHDRELVALALERLRAEGIKIIEHATVQRVERCMESGIRVHFRTEDSAHVLEGTHLLLAAGRKPNVEALGLDKAGIACDPAGIRVSPMLRTTNRRVYAIGDVAGGLQFTHVASHHAALVLRAILFRLPFRMMSRHVPRVVYTDPEIAEIGLSEAEARSSERHVTIVRSAFSENDRAQTERETAGLIKLVLGRRGRILGVSIAGRGAAEMMHFWSLVLYKRMSIRDVAGYVAPYPTFGEIGKRAALASLAPAAKNPTLRRLIGFLRLFG